MVFVCYERCSTCQKAKKWLEDNGVPFEVRPIREQNPTAEELRIWQKKRGLPLKRFFNTSGLLYKSMELSKRLPTMSEEEQLSLLASDGMLVKRPLLVGEKTVLVGFREDGWRDALENEML